MTLSPDIYLSIIFKLLKHPKATLMDILTSNSENQFSILIGIVKKCGLQEVS